MKLTEIAIQKESADEHIIVSMMERLQPMLKAGRVYYQYSPVAKPSRLVWWKPELQDIPGLPGGVVEMEVQSSTPGDYREWRASLPVYMLDDYTIASEGTGDAKIWILKKKDDITESVDMPVIVSMLKRLIKNHFKKSGPDVILVDMDLGVSDSIYGYQWLNGNLTLHIRQYNTSREIIYPQNKLSGMTLNRSKDGAWVLLYDPAKVDPDEATPPL